MSREIKVMYDREADVLAIIFDENSKNHDFVEPIPGWLIWYDENKNVRMIEIFRTSIFLWEKLTLRYSVGCLEVYEKVECVFNKKAPIKLSLQQNINKSRQRWAGAMKSKCLGFRCF